MGSTTVELEVNGRLVSANVAPGLSLLRFLRDQLRLTGTKDGCSQGHCGTCMVLIDGQPTRSCLVKMDRAQGKQVQTIEGITWKSGLHPFQQALIDTSAIQCGFCIPGMVISGVALLARNHEPSPSEIKEALGLNLCRCGGYPKIIQAAQQAAQVLAGSRQAEPARRYVGRVVGESTPDKEGEEKVTGRLVFADDMYLEGMLYGKVLWSRYPHARILSIDTSRAERVRGVAVALTSRDVPGRNGFGEMIANQPVLCHDKVRFLGDAVAVVFAETVGAAEKGCAAIEVDYEELEVVGSPQRALEPDAPLVHEKGNVCRHILRQVGDVEEGFREADVVVEGHYTTPFVEHAYMEPESGLAVPVANGRVAIYYPSQKPFETRAQIAASLGVAEDQVRVISTPIGGGFGSKGDITTQILLAMGALRTGKPCKITLTRPESLIVSAKRHAFFIENRVGATQDGRLTAVEARIMSDAGPYAGLSFVILNEACSFSTGPYVVPHARIEGWAVYTNNANGGAFRGFGINQVAFALESSLDVLARKLGLDPFDLRLRNALEVGKSTLLGEKLRASVPIKETLRAAREALGRKALPKASGRKRIGVGVAAGIKSVGPGKGLPDDAGAVVELTVDGDILVRVSTVDMGQGNRTTMAQIAAETIGVAYDRIKLVTGDTDLVHKARGGVGQRQTFCGGNAVLGASRQFRDMLLSYVAKQYSLSPENLSLSDQGILDGGKVIVTLSELGRFTAGEGEAIQADYYYAAPRTYPPFSDWDLTDRAVVLTRYEPQDVSKVRPEDYSIYLSYAYATQVAVVEVDETTGQVKVLKMIAAHDVGRALNPLMIEGQLEGSCLMGMGYALTEEYRVENGMHLTRNLRQCRIPTIKDLPEIECIIIEEPEPRGPLGAKGISEVATVPITPAIINAIYDAVGVRITDLPATKDKVLGQIEQLRLSRGVQPRSRRPEANSQVPI